MRRTHFILQLFAFAIALFVFDTRTASAQYSYYPLTPCRSVDTRNANGTNGGPALTTARRDFAIKGTCGVPTTAKAVTINVTITNATATSWLTIWPAGQVQPVVSTINFGPGDTLANGAIVGLGSGSPDLSVLNAIGTTHVIIDVTGFFQ